MSTLLESLASTGPADPRPRGSLDALLSAGMPSARSEAWKYTSLRALDRRAFAVAPRIPPAVPASLLAGIAAPRLVFVNGAYDERLSDVGTAGASLRCEVGDGHDRLFAADPVDPRDDVFPALAHAQARAGAAVTIGKSGTHADVIHLVFIGAAAASDQAWHLRNRILLEAGARATVCEHHLAASAHAHLANALTLVELGPGASLTHVRMQAESAMATSFLRTECVLQAGASYARLDLELGAALSRHELSVRLEGEQASLVSNGVHLAQSRRHLDTRLAIEHVARDTNCRLTWRGLAADRGRSVFRGGIVIRAGADGSDASLSSKNLLLSDAAEIDAQPVLEIHADEVKAAHGATVGQLDPAALFYLRSRGLPEPEARQLMTAAFTREPLSIITDRDLREALERRLDESLLGRLPA